MKGRSDIISFVHHQKMSLEHLESFIRDNPGSKGASLFSVYFKRVKWILNDLVTNPNFSNEVAAGLNHELKSDSYSVVAINEMIPLLNPEQREIIEDVIRQLVDGKMELTK